MRKQRRQAELQDNRDRMRMGITAPDPPKGILLILINHSVILMLHSSSGQLDEGFDLRCRPRSHTRGGSCAP